VNPNQPKSAGSGSSLAPGKNSVKPDDVTTKPAAGDAKNPLASKARRVDVKPGVVIAPAMLNGPETAWDDYFKSNKPSSSSVADVVLKLLSAKKHGQIVALLEAALIHGQAQPWMYEALAVSMEAVGRPADEIERVMLSSVDFSAFDVPNLVYSATYLASSGREKRALDLCRQASRIDPSRPEPYALGLKLASKIKDPEGLEWAAAGTLSRVWIKNYAELHKQAERAVIDLEDQLRKSGRAADADRLTSTLADARQRDIEISLSWTGNADLDLLIEEPTGSICSFERQRTAGGGVFVHDGYGPDPKNAYELYLCPQAMSGDYRLTVKHVWGEVVGRKAELKITRYKGTPRESVEKLFVSVGERPKHFRMPLRQGRLKEPLPVPVLDDLLTARRTPKNKPLHLQELARSAESARAKYLKKAGVRALAGALPVGYQPIISVISDGVTSQAMATVSADRRFVRLTLNPTFSALTDVQTFSFFSQ